MELRRLSDTGLAERPRIAVVDALTGCLLALTDSIQIRAAVGDGTGLGPPPETDGYRPSAPLDRFVRLRDRRCRFPGCRARARRSDLDHRTPHPLGPTSHHDLESLCEHHHRLSHQAPGWQLSGSGDGGLVWTLPGGATLTTVPPRFGADDGRQPATTGRNRTASSSDTEDVDWRRLTPDQRREQMRLRICGRPPRPGDRPAPF
ncbi:HNH endonuclease signature motif containing protein [Blastococcus sp. SYSU D00813]